uniref:Uncharacterized protein n=1 Tax=Panagrolaimus davidi TaxID=227884 RepID=A0A914PCV5_9BILA
MVGLGWNDLTNEYTLPIFKETYFKCLTDYNNQFLIPDNIFLIPVKHTTLDRTSSTFDSYDKFMSSDSNKITVTGSISGQGKSASA